MKIVACLFDEKAELRVAFNDSCYSTERISQQVLHVFKYSTKVINEFVSFIHTFSQTASFLVSMKRVTAILVFKLTMKGKQSSSLLEQSIPH